MRLIIQRLFRLRPILRDEGEGGGGSGSGGGAGTGAAGAGAAAAAAAAFDPANFERSVANLPGAAEYLTQKYGAEAAKAAQIKAAADAKAAEDKRAAEENPLKAQLEAIQAERAAEALINARKDAALDFGLTREEAAALPGSTAEEIIANAKWAQGVKTQAKADAEKAAKAQITPTPFGRDSVDSEALAAKELTGDPAKDRPILAARVSEERRKAREAQG